jgi:hypothetical protein
MKAMALGLLALGMSALPWGAMAQTTADDIALRQARADLAKTELANLQSALTAVDPSKVKVGSVTAPKLTATSYQRLIEALGALDINAEFGLKKDDTVVWQRPGIDALLETYENVNAQLRAGWQDLQHANNDLDPSPQPHPGRNTAELVAPAAGVALANLAASFAAALKAQYGFETSPLDSSSRLEEAFVQQKLRSLGLVIFDPMASPKACYDDASSLDTDFQCENTHGDSPLITRAKALKTAIDKSRKTLAAETAKLPPPPGEGRKDPKKQRREALAAFGKTISEVDDAYRKLYVPSATNAVPFIVALRGEAVSKRLSGENAHLLELTPLVSDVDAIARDKLFDSYKLAMRLTTAFQLKVTHSDGSVETKVFSVGSRSWENVEMPWKPRSHGGASTPH